ncbi:MAG TPA: DegT/DnrJ/EryC1/StrS family aminotransferase [Candidatus Bathyarchaeia archaeon]|nr:DegT/DnrJ/EryC1/StrS family aminotransferase [Candidatus Bathyarchaeia archaeon]
MRPVVDEEMLQAALFSLQNEKLVMGESVYKFEEEFARYCSTRYAVSTASGTAALQIALQSMGIDEEDEVMTTPFSFFATSNAVIHAGAQPTFADVEKDGFNLDPKKVELKLTPKTRAVIPVHLYGHPSRMKEFKDLADDKGISIVEDACQAHGAEYQGRRVGSLGHVGVFSFYTSKNMTVCGDGGMIVTNDEQVAEAARSFRDCGRASKYTMSRIGYTSRLNTVNAAIGRVQLKKLDQWNEARREMADMYRRELEGVAGVELPPAETTGTTPVYHLFVVQSDHRDKIASHLEKNGVEAAIHYPVPIHLQAPYRTRYGYSEGSFPLSERLAERVLSLPIHPAITAEEVRSVSRLVRETTTAE